MSRFVELLQHLKDRNVEVVVVIGATSRRVRIHRIDDDRVTLHDQDSPDRYDLHHAAVVIVSQSSGTSPP